MGSDATRVIPIASVLTFLGTWEVIARAFFVPAVLPAPSHVLGTLGQSLLSGVLIQHAAITEFRVLLGFGAGSTVGFLLGFAAGASWIARTLIEPYVGFFRFVPAVALLTPFMVWFGIGELPKILLLTFATAFTVYLSTLAGFARVPANRIRAARMMGTSPLSVLTRVVLPSIIPEVTTGMRIAMGISFATVIIAELVASDVGLGFLLIYGRTITATDVQFVAIAGIGFLGFVTDRVFEASRQLLLNRYFRV